MLAGSACYFQGGPVLRGMAAQQFDQRCPVSIRSRRMQFRIASGQGNAGAGRQLRGHSRNLSGRKASTVSTGRDDGRPKVKSATNCAAAGLV